jgi:hypothetical protein
MILRRLAWVVLLVFLAGCASKPTKLYVLTQVDPGSRTWGQSVQAKDCIRLDLGQVSFPGYLDRSGIMTRVGPNQLRLSELHHWAEPLKESFVRVLAENLGTWLCAKDAAVISRPKANAEFRLQVQVLRFEPVKRKQAVLVAYWSVFHPESGEVICSRHADYRHSLQGEDHQAAVAAMSKALSSLSDDISHCLVQRCNAPSNS